jgi:class 3 adenylate cyclase
MEDERMSVIEASIEVLTPKKRKVSCIFSDIRGFTQGSKDLEAFIKESVIPEVKACSDAIEDFGGIPRKIGDLIFAYFDEESVERNIVASAAAAMAISRLNQDMNETANMVRIKRYVLLSYGEALVGNLGGLDSSIEITALGSPVNFLSRLDEATKNRALADKLSPGDLVLSQEFSKMLASLVPDVTQSEIDLQKIGVSIRDFDDVRYVYSVSPSDLFYSNLVEALDAKFTRLCGIDSPGRVAA